MSNHFQRAFRHVLEVEGGYTDHASDRGGRTTWGITEAVARRHGYTGDMQDLPQATAEQIYRADYWAPLRLDDIAERSYPVALELFDTGVNMGIRVAGRFLQQSLNVLNDNGRLYADLAVDGVIGPASLSALDAYLSRRGAEGEMVLLRALNVLQGARYIEISNNNPTQQAFTYGWLRTRVEIPSQEKRHD